MSTTICFVCHVCPQYQQLGTHIPLASTLLETVQNALTKGMTAFQIFLGSPQSTQSRLIHDQDCAKTKELIHRFNLSCFVHSPYILNFAKSDKHIYQLSCIQDLLNKTRLFGGKGVVLHPGSHSDTAAGIKAIADGLSKLQFHPNELLLLENMAGQGNVLGGTLEELNEMLIQICKPNQQFIGFCIDTAHLWGRGEYRIDTVDGVNAFWNRADELGMSKRVRLIHLNDSAVSFGSHVDRHALIGEGNIWSEDSHKIALKHWMDECSRRDIPMVMETDPSDIEKFYIVYN